MLRLLFVIDDSGVIEYMLMVKHSVRYYEDIRSGNTAIYRDPVSLVAIFSVFVLFNTGIVCSCVQCIKLIEL